MQGERDKLTQDLLDKETTKSVDELLELIKQDFSTDPKLRWIEQMIRGYERNGRRRDMKKEFNRIKRLQNKSKKYRPTY